MDYVRAAGPGEQAGSLCRAEPAERSAEHSRAPSLGVGVGQSTLSLVVDSELVM